MLYKVMVSDAVQISKTCPSWELCRFQEWGPQAAEMLDPEKETLVLCHHGVRSMRAAMFLASQGFTEVKNISGGIDAYSRQVDSSVPLY